MNSQEAINALFEGKCVRHSSWTNGQYIYLQDGKPVYNKIAFASMTPSELLFYEYDWEICKEMYQWLCLDTKTNEFSLSKPIQGNPKHVLWETRYKVIKRLDETRKVFK